VDIYFRLLPDFELTVIRFPPHYLEPPVDLLYEYQAHELVGEGEGRKGKLQMAPGLYFIGKAQGTAYDKSDVGYAGDHEALKFFGHLLGGILLAFDAKGYNKA
jgi:hypothetical protein